MIDILSYKLGQKSGGGSGGGGGGGGGGSNEEWIGDGNTHLWISLPEGRTSPMLGVGVDGTVTVDWGDGSTPDVLTGTSTRATQWTPSHEYAAAGNYVITLNVDGEIGFNGQNMTNAYAFVLRYSSTSDGRNIVYQNALKKIEIGNNVTSIGENAFRSCRSLASIVIPNSVTNIGSFAFCDCGLASIVIPNSMTSIGSYAFYSCPVLATITIPDSVTSIGDNAFSGNRCLETVIIPDSVTSIGNNAFSGSYILISITIPNSVTRIGDSAFGYCYSMKLYDFTKHTAVPTLSGTNAFSNIPADCEIRVPAALVDEWKAATNWSTYADKIVGV